MDATVGDSDRGRPRRSLTPGTPRSPRALRLLVSGTLIAVLGAVAWWYLTHPEALPTSDARITATVPRDQEVYVGAFDPGPTFDRTLHISAVDLQTTSNVDVVVTALLCLHGSVGVTADAAAFCNDLIDPDGATFHQGDEIVLRVSGNESGAVVINRLRLSYREGIRRATRPAGSEVVVRFLP